MELAELIIDAVPSVEMVRLVNSGTEATMSALRVARGFTGRTLTVKFEGCYHGHVDSLLVKAGSGVATLGIPDTRGGARKPSRTPPSRCRLMIWSGRTMCSTKRGDQIAAVIVEPVAGTWAACCRTGISRRACGRSLQHYGALLIFDEVMTGFR